MNTTDFHYQRSTAPPTPPIGIQAWEGQRPRASEHITTWTNQSIVCQTVHFSVSMAWLVVFLPACYRCIGGESWKEPASYLPMLCLIVRPTQGPSLVYKTQIDSGQLQPLYWGIREQMPQRAEAFLDLPFHPRCRQSPGLGRLYLIECSNHPQHRVLCLHIPLHMQCLAQSCLLHSWGSPAGKLQWNSNSNIVEKKNMAMNFKARGG